MIAADDIAAVERSARADTLVIAAQTFFLVDDDRLRRLAEVPGDRLVVEPVARTREVLAPEIRTDGVGGSAAGRTAICGKPPGPGMCNSA